MRSIKVQYVETHIRYYILLTLEDGEAVGLAERHVSRQLRLAYLAPEVLKRLTCGREATAVSLYDLCFLAGEAWGDQTKNAFEPRK